MTRHPIQSIFLVCNYRSRHDSNKQVLYLSELSIFWIPFQSNIYTLEADIKQVYA